MKAEHILLVNEAFLTNQKEIFSNTMYVDECSFTFDAYMIRIYFSVNFYLLLCVISYFPFPQKLTQKKAILPCNECRKLNH